MSECACVCDWVEERLGRWYQIVHQCHTACVLCKSFHSLPWKTWLCADCLFVYFIFWHSSPCLQYLVFQFLPSRIITGKYFSIKDNWAAFFWRASTIFLTEYKSGATDSLMYQQGCTEVVLRMCLVRMSLFTVYDKKANLKVLADDSNNTVSFKTNRLFPLLNQKFKPK